MNSNTKYIGMDVHRESISIAVRNAAGKIVMESVIETKASMILEFVERLRGDVHVTFEEGTWAAWLYDLMKPHVTRLVVCDPRRNALLQEGNQNDRVDARKLAELLQNNQLRSVYHGDHGLRTLKELVRSYLTITKDLSRVMIRVKAIYRSWAIPCSGKQVYGSRHRAEWLGKIQEPGVRRRAEFYYQQLDALRVLAPGSTERFAGGEQEAQGLETALSDSVDWSDPGGGVAGHPADSAPVPHQATAVDLQWFGHRGAQQRRSSKRERPAATEEEACGDSRAERELQSRSEEFVQGCGGCRLDQARPFKEFYAALLAKGMRPEMARLTLARKIATIVLIIWKRGVCFDANHLKPQTA